MSDFEPVAPLNSEGDDDLWLVSYADLLTLLLAFFVLMLSMTSLSRGRFETLASVLRGDSQNASLQLRADVNQVAKELGADVTVREEASGLGIEFRGGLLFPSGSAALRPDGTAAVSRIADALKKLSVASVVVEGHSDDLPVVNGLFHSNWDLSAARAISVLEALEASGVPRQWMSVKSFADTRPISAETLEQSRAASRRVVVRVE